MRKLVRRINHHLPGRQSGELEPVHTIPPGHIVGKSQEMSYLDDFKHFMISLLLDLDMWHRMFFFRDGCRYLTCSAPFMLDSIPIYLTVDLSTKLSLQGENTCWSKSSIIAVVRLSAR